MSLNRLTSFIDIFVVPNRVFNRIKEQRLSAWPPFLVIVGLSIAMATWYFLTVDFYQFLDVSMMMSGQEVTSIELEQMLKAESLIRLSSIAVVSIPTFFVYVIIALYFHLISLVVSHDKSGFSLWLSLVAWGSLPSLLSVLSMAISYLTLLPDFALFQSLDKTSIAGLLGLSWENRFFNVLSITTIGMIWSYILYGVGFKVLTRCKAITAVIVGLVPMVTQFGLVLLT